MKKKTLLAVAASTVLLVGCDDGSLFDPHTKTIKSDSVVRISAAGNDLRLYEFTPNTMPDYQCIFVSGERKGGLFCDKKPLLPQKN